MIFSKLAASLVAVTTLVLSLNAWAGQRNYASHPEAQALIDEMVAEHAFDRQHLQQLFAQVEYKDSIVNLMDRPAEATKPWKDYRSIFFVCRVWHADVDPDTQKSGARIGVFLKFGDESRKL